MFSGRETSKLHSINCPEKNIHKMSSNVCFTMGNVIFIHHIHNINIGLTEETTLNKSSTSTASNLSSGRSHSRKNSKPKRSLPFATPELVKKKPHLDEVIPKVSN